MTLVSVKGGLAHLSHRRRKHRWQLRGAKQLSELRSAKAPVAAETARNPIGMIVAGGSVKVCSGVIADLRRICSRRQLLENLSTEGTVRI